MIKTLWTGFRIVSVFCLIIAAIIGFGAGFQLSLFWLMTHGHRIIGWSIIGASAVAMFLFVCYVIGIFETI
jgi:hypothetical protein